MRTSPCTMIPVPTLLCGGLLALNASPALGQGSDLGDHYGFDGLEVIKIDVGAGPVSAVDLDGDDHGDLIVVNNRKNRLELHHQKPGARPSDQLDQIVEANEIPEHWRFRRVEVPAINQVRSVLPHDFDGDGLTDIIYAGTDPGAIVFLRQVSPGEWKVTNRKFVSGLMPSRDSVKIADIVGDESPELLALVKGRINVWPLDGDSTGQPTTLSGGDTNFAAIMTEDLDGNGLLDLVAVSPDDSAPVRMWMADERDEEKVLGAQLRFEMPPLREGTTLRTSDDGAAMLALIEKPTNRMVLLKLANERIDSSGDREAAYEVFSFNDPGNRDRKVAVVDLKQDGAFDVLATNQEANAVSIYHNTPDEGLSAPTLAPAYAELSGLVSGDLSGDGTPEVFMLSETEGVVGRSRMVNGRLSFPESIAITNGSEPVALDMVQLSDGPRLAIITKDGRKYALELVDSAGMNQRIELGSMSRAPQTVLSVDTNQNGHQDLLLLTPDRDAALLLNDGTDQFTLVESPGQEKLLRAANARNTAVMDFDGSGREDLLLADRNFVRALRFESDDSGSGGGWTVVDQINAPRTDVELVALMKIDDHRIAASDRENGHIIIFERDADGGSWAASDTITLRGFKFDDLRLAGESASNDEILAIGDGGFAVVRLAGERASLEEVASWRPDNTNEVPHEIGVGDVNHDGMVDLVVLDAGTQAAHILGLSEAGRLVPATSFEVFESRMFSGGEPREFEPREVLVTDVTGDQRKDLVLLSHDRVLLYPQDSPE
ncbi:MAG: VCBS repeat-containing protein [Planctomycetota bacterium]|nr:VCBS repeat-containing protein [Planctomycetota bacterium]